MSSAPSRAAGRRPVGFTFATVATLFTFGCTTVRAPVSGIAATVPIHGSTAEPQVELWLESADDPSAEESRRAVGEARKALRKALQGREVGEDDILVVRAQAVTRTDSHREHQQAAIAGLAVGVVALVALAVVAVVASGGGSRSGRASRGGGSFRGGGVSIPGSHGSGGRGGGAFVPGGHWRAGRAEGAADRGWAGGRRVPVVVPVGPASRTARGGGAAGMGVDLDVAVVPPSAEAPPPVEPFAAAVDGTPAPGEVVAAPPPAPWPPSAPSAAGRLSALTLPPPPPLAPAGRGFFEGDWVRLELLVVDARTGAVRRAKVLTEDVDVRDALKIGQLIDGALASANGWDELEATP